MTMTKEQRVRSLLGASLRFLEKAEEVLRTSRPYHSDLHQAVCDLSVLVARVECWLENDNVMEQVSRVLRSVAKDESHFPENVK